MDLLRPDRYAPPKTEHPKGDDFIEETFRITRKSNDKTVQKPKPEEDHMEIQVGYLYDGRYRCITTNCRPFGSKSQEQGWKQDLTLCPAVHITRTFVTRLAHMSDAKGNLTGTLQLQRHAEIYIDGELVKTGILQPAVVQEGSTEHSLAAAYRELGQPSSKASL